jgi:predicted transcriptional regulator
MADKDVPGEFVKIYRFMTCGLNLKGSELLVYARVFSFSEESSYVYFESQARCAKFLNISVRQVRRSLAVLEQRGLIFVKGPLESSGKKRRFVVINGEAVADALLRLEGPAEPRLST